MGDLFNQPEPTGEQLKQHGIRQAIEHADNVVESWSIKAYNLFFEYIKTVEQFKTEDARVYAEEKGLEIPPTKRAWGAVVLKLARQGYIKRIGIVTVDNPKAHKGFTALWGVVQGVVI